MELLEVPRQARLSSQKGLGVIGLGSVFEHSVYYHRLPACIVIQSDDKQQGPVDERITPRPDPAVHLLSSTQLSRCALHGTAPITARY